MVFGSLNTYAGIGDINSVNDFLALMISKDLKTELEVFVINKVREKRIEANFSQKYIANELDVAVGFIGHVESPKYRAKYNLNHLNQLAKIFKCSIKDFLPDPYLDSSSD